MAQIWVMQHVHCEDLGIIAQVLQSFGLAPRYVQTFAGQPVPQKMKAAAGLIVMGGPMGVYEHTRHPFLLDEMRLIEQALKEEKPVLGICLGSQLLAAALGADVKRAPSREIGWHRVELTGAGQADRLCQGMDREFVGYHWHGDVFDLPAGATCLAASEQTPCQAFSSGAGAYGFLFHMEITQKTVQDMVSNFADELREEQLDGQEILAQADEFLPALQHQGWAAFQNWAALVLEKSG